MSVTLTERYQAVKAEAHQIFQAATAEGRDQTEVERARFDALLAEAQTLLPQVDRVNADARALASLTEVVSVPAVEAAAGSIGDRFVNSEQYQTMLASYGGRIPERTRVQMGTVTVSDVKAALLESPGFQSPTTRIAPASLTVVDLFDAITVVEGVTPGSSIKTFTGAFTNAAADVAEGDTKPESALVWTPATLTMATTAHHIPVTNQALAHNPTLRARIDTHLVNGVRARIQAKVAATMAAAVGMQTQAFDTNLRTTLRRAITKAQNGAAAIGAGPPVVVISANDAEKLDLEQIANLVLSPGEMPAQGTSIWRAPLVVSAALPDGFAYVGDTRQVELYIAEPGISITTGWVDQQFIENSLTLLAEVENAVGVLGAGALVKTALTGGG